MNRCRLQVLYSGMVQGVGFRFTVRSLSQGFDVTGFVRNMPDGRVELVAEGTRDELEAFQEAIRNSGLSGLIEREDTSWLAALGNLRGFEIAR